MRRIAAFLLVTALLCAAPAWSKTKTGKSATAAKKGTETAAAKPKSGPRTAEAAGAAVSAQLTRLQEMLQAQSKQIEAQQKQIETLQNDIRARATASGTAAQPAAVAPTATPNTATASSMVPVASEPTAKPAEQPVASAPSKVAVASHPSAAKAASLDQGTQLPSDIELADGRIKLGFTVYGDWAWYPNTSYGPQFETQINQPGPGNDNFNSFDINRAYINFFFTPKSGKYTIRLTPNIYRDLGGVSPQAFGSNAQIGGTANGSLNLRMKYAYVQFNHPFASSSEFGKDKITLGQTTNPLIDWQEAFYGYRFTSLVPWNYLSLSSTHMGAKIGGPIITHGKKYLDYEAGVFDSGSFHNQEQAAEKQVMARLSLYPLSGTGRFGGFGLSAFVDFGYANKAPNLQNASTNSLYRTAFFASYWSPRFAILGEYDYGKNAFSIGNLFSGSAPISTDPTYGYLVSEASGILTSSAQQRGFDFFGHYNIPHSPFSLFGLYQYFQPNINVNKDPLDFERIVGGISYKYDKYLEFALDSQNLIFTHSQFTYSGIPNAVPNNVNALFLNAEFNY